MKEDATYLRHILESIRRVEENTAAGYEGFMASHTLQDAVMRNLQTMAESTQRLSDAAKHAHSEVDWRAISGPVLKAAAASQLRRLDPAI